MAMCVLDKQEIYWNDGNTPKGKGREIVGLGCRALGSQSLREAELRLGMKS